MFNRKYILILLLIFIMIFTACTSELTEETTELNEMPILNIEEETAVVLETTIIEIATEPEILEDIRTLTILSVGDIMSHDDNIKSAYNEVTGEYSFIEPFKYVKPYIEKADFAIANFETVTAGEESRYTSFPLFNTPDPIIDGLKDAGFDLLITANNHSLDRWSDGVKKTIDEIDKRELLHTGTYKKPQDRVLYNEVNGFKLATIAYTYACNGNLQRLTLEEQKYMVNIIDEKKIKEDIEKAKENNTDIIIVYLHWGSEYQRNPRKDQENMAKRIFEYGADIILGTHPHVVQKSEIMNINGENKYIVYSMGNYYHNFRRTSTTKRPNKIHTEEGVMPIITFQKDFLKADSKAEIVKIIHIPTLLDKYIEDDKIIFHILPTEDLNINDKEYTLDRNKQFLIDSYNNTFDLVKDIFIDNSPY